MSLRFAVVFSLLSIFASQLFAQPINPRTLRQDIGIVQELGAQVPVDAILKDEEGKTVRIGDYLNQGRPVIIVPMFFRCGGTCIQIQEGSMKCFRAMKYKDIGRDFIVLNISIHPKETSDLARIKKVDALTTYDPKNMRPTAGSGWHFLTGDLANLKKVMSSIGYKFEYDAINDRVAHPAGMILLTPDGRVSKYFYGFAYSQRFLLLALADAQAQKVGTKEEPRFFGCISIDPATGQMTMNVMRTLQVAGILTAIILFTSIFLMTIRNRRTHLNGRAPQA